MNFAFSVDEVVAYDANYNDVHCDNDGFNERNGHCKNRGTRRCHALELLLLLVNPFVWDHQSAPISLNSTPALLGMVIFKLISL